MASIAISASLHRACSLNHVPRRQQLGRTVGTKQATNVVTADVDGLAKGLMLNIAEHKDNAASGKDTFKVAGDKSEQGRSLESSAIKFKDEQWKNGSWDLNMFVKDGKMDWDGVIVAGQAAMLGFFMAYVVDALTGMGVVGQIGNVLCKAGLFTTVLAVPFFWRNQDMETLRKLADEATFYDKQWQASWQDEAGSTSASDSSAEKM